MLAQIILAMAKQAGTVTTLSQQINDLQEFLLDNIPYGKVSPQDLLPGFVEYDGPAQPHPTPKKSLRWHFGGEPYKITKALRIRYTYVKNYDATQVSFTGSLLVGFQVPPQGVVVPPDPSLTLATGDLGHSVDALKELAAWETARHPTTILSVAQKIPDVGNFVQTHSPYGLVPFAGQILGRPLEIEYDGPAQTYDSGQPFPYTQATLFSDREKYGQLLWWYFGGKPWGVTKAIRIEYTRTLPAPAGGPAPAPITESLFFGYQGPGNFP